MEPHDFKLGSQKVGEERVRRGRRRRMNVLLREREEENEEREEEEGEVVDGDPVELWKRTNS